MIQSPLANATWPEPETCSICNAKVGIGIAERTSNLHGRILCRDCGENENMKEREQREIEEAQRIDAALKEAI
jgi:DNA-directed RNA polymerase subunit RPC12/RpoP